MGGEILVDAEIATKVSAREFGQIEPIVEDRPEHAVREPIIEFLVVVLTQIDRGIRDVVVCDGLDPTRLILRNSSAPAEPEAAVPLECGSDRNFEPTGPRAAIRQTNSVRHYDEPRQYRSPQLRDSLIAVKINPDIE